MLHPIAKLTENFLGKIGRILGDEIDSDPFGTNQTHHLLHLLEQRLGGIPKQQVCFVKEEDQLWFVQISSLGQSLKKFCHHPEQEGGIQGWLSEQADAVQDIDGSPSLRVQLHPVIDIQGWLPEEHLSALLFQGQQTAQDGPHALGGNGSILQSKLPGMIPHILDHGPQVLEIQEQQPLFIRDPEHDGKHAGLHLVEV